ncbi:DUF6603 domain-containing protein [Actinoplanes subglobosus]|uniref:DUF6603 domain-containing protein n=1 Tax=Actinoplanes subglobosus TaxID=1547892 RepID=A0ABV8IU19_9ACTN
MSDVEDFLIEVAGRVLEALQPLPRLARSAPEFAAVVAEFGWPAPPGADLSAVRAPFDIGDALDDLVRLLTTGDASDPALVIGLVADTADLAALVQAMVAGPPDRAALPAPFDSAEFWATFPPELFEWLFLRVLERDSPGIAAVLGLIGVIDEFDVPASGARGAYRRKALDLGNLISFLTDPLTHLRDQFGWGDGRTLDQDRVLTRLGGLVRLLGPARVGMPRDGVIEPYWTPAARPGLRELTGTLAQSYDPDTGLFGAVTVAALPIPATGTQSGDPAGLALTLAAVGGVGVTVEFPLGPFVLALEGALQGETSLTVDLRPDGVAAHLDASARVEAGIALRRDEPLVLLGSPGGMRLELGRLEVRVGAAGEPDDIEFLAGFSVQDLAFVLQAASADSFLGRFLGTDPQAITLDVELMWSSKKGLRLAAAAGFRFLIAAHLEIAILRIETILIELVADTERGIVLNLAVDTVFTLGPVVVTVSRVGASAVATPVAAGGTGNLGPLDVAFGFKPPDGAGLLIDAAVVKGGGYALFDHTAGQYAGILQLSIQELVSITAIGLVATKMPDGSRGFSMLVILTAEFPPIQLGLGFTLSGLGGIFGFNRTMNLEALRAGARTGVLDSILFPRDPLANVPKVISDVQSVFPIAPGRFVIGLMARLGWGSPQLLVVDLGIVVELPAPIVIALLGRVSLVLPEPENAVVELHLDVIGILDLGRGEVSIDASLYDSRIAMFTISGDMAARIGWGATKMFAVSAGGFHPRFDPPPGFPQLRRLAISLATGDNPRVRLESYFATTSNSVQTGARLEVYAELDAGFIGLFSAQAFLGFDVLIILKPFSFVADMYGGVEIRRNGTPILAATVFLSLSGPEPWHAWGYAELVFFGKHRIPVDVTIGDDPDPVAPEPLDPVADLLAAVGDAANWEAQLPDPGQGVVTLREFDSPAVLAHPLGRLTVRQQIVPLGVTIDVYGGQPAPAGADHFTLGFRIGGEPADGTRTEVRADLAAGQFFALADDEKLSRPAFEPLLCGYSGIGTPATTQGPAEPGTQGYTTRIVDDDEPLPDYTVATPVLGFLSATAAPGYHGPSMGITVAAPAYAIASTTDLTGAGGPFPSHVEAAAARPAGTATQIVGAHEVNA